MTDAPLSLPRGQQLALGNLMGVGSMVFWAAGFPAAEVLLDTWDPLALIFARFVMAMLILLPVWLLVDGGAVLRNARWGRGTFVGGLAFGVGAYLIILAQWLTDPVTVAIIAAASPVTATVIEMIWGKRRLRLPFILGLAASVIGGVIATGNAPQTHLGLGAFLAIIACFLFTWGSFIAVRDFPDLTPLGRTTITLFGGLVVTGVAFVIAVLAHWVPVPTQIWDGQTIGLMAIYGLGGLALSQFLWIAAVGRLGVAVTAFHINIAPFYVMLFLVALGQAWSWPQAIGAAVVALGVVLAQR